MITDLDVYVAYKTAEAAAKGRTGFRLPKDWDVYKTEKMNKFAYDQLYKLMVHFNTSMRNVDMAKFMSCGFEIWKSFSYQHFFEKPVLNLYMQYDKQKKRRIMSDTAEVDKSFAYIADFLKTKPIREGYNQLQNFCKFRDGEIRTIINLYVQDKIDTITLVYCLKKRYIVLSDDERAITPYISQRYRDLCDNLVEMQDYMDQKERELDEYKDQ
jgi:hypothetical protein